MCTALLYCDLQILTLLILHCVETIVEKFVVFE